MKLTKYLKWSKNTNFNKITYPHCGKATTASYISIAATFPSNTSTKVKIFHPKSLVAYLQAINHSISRYLTPFIKN